MRKFLAAGLIITGVLLAGCGENNAYLNAREFNHTLNDGRIIHCVKFGVGDGSSVTCDWGNAK